MSRERALLFVALAALLVGGLLVARNFGGGVAVMAERDDSEFRDWFWSHRGLDLATQVGLILAGALGVAAILPDAQEDEDACTSR